MIVYVDSDDGDATGSEGEGDELVQVRLFLISSIRFLFLFAQFDFSCHLIKYTACFFGLVHQYSMSMCRSIVLDINYLPSLCLNNTPFKPQLITSHKIYSCSKIRAW